MVLAHCQQELHECVQVVRLKKMHVLRAKMEVIHVKALHKEKLKVLKEITDSNQDSIKHVYCLFCERVE